MDNNPYTPIFVSVVAPRWKMQFAKDLLRYSMLMLICLGVTYVVSLPASRMMTKDGALIAMSPFIPVGLLATTIAGETIWALLITFLGCPATVVVIVGALGVRKRRALVAAIAMGAVYGLFLRLFYLMYDIA